MQHVIGPENRELKYFVLVLARQLPFFKSIAA